VILVCTSFSIRRCGIAAISHQAAETPQPQPIHQPASILQADGNWERRRCCGQRPRIGAVVQHPVTNAVKTRRRTAVGSQPRAGVDGGLIAAAKLGSPPAALPPSRSSVRPRPYRTAGAERPAAAIGNARLADPGERPVDRGDAHPQQQHLMSRPICRRPLVHKSAAQRFRTLLITPLSRTSSGPGWLWHDPPCGTNRHRPCLTDAPQPWSPWWIEPAKRLVIKARNA
jgi:hypothetical protein